MRSDKFGSQLDRKSKTWFFTFLNVHAYWIEWDKILISQLSPPKLGYFGNQNGRKRGSHENELWLFSNTKMNITNSQSSTSRCKKCVICLVSFFPSWVMVLRLPKIIYFFQICVIKAIYLPPSDLIMLFQKILIFIGVWTAVHEILKNKISKKVLNQQKFSKIHELQKLIFSKL